MNVPQPGSQRFARSAPQVDTQTRPPAVRSLSGIYHLHPLVAGPLREWSRWFDHIAGMGFRSVCLAPPFEPGGSGDIFVHATFDRLHPRLGFDGPAWDGIAWAVRAADAVGLRLLLDMTPDQVAADAPVHQRHPDWFGAEADIAPDPRRQPTRLDVAVPRAGWASQADGLSDWWIAQATRLLQTGVAGFRCMGLDRVPRRFWRDLASAVSAEQPNATLIAWTPGVPRATVPGLSGLGFDRTCSSAAWWDGRAAWFFDEYASLHAVAPPLSSPEPSFQDRLVHRLSPDADIPVAYRLALSIGAATGAGLFVPMGFEYASARPFDAISGTPDDMEAARAEAPVDLSADIAAAIRTVEMEAEPCLIRPLVSPESPVTTWLRSPAADIREAPEASLVLVNPDTIHAQHVGFVAPVLPPSAGAPFALADPGAATSPLYPGEVRILDCRRTADIAPLPAPDLSANWAAVRRIGIEAVEPAVPGGDFPVKTEVGRPVAVTADIIFDGHDLLAADLLWRSADQDVWTRYPMRLEGNDRWTATVVPDRNGLYHFAVEAWWDQWGSLIHDLSAKQAAGQDVSLEAEEARQLLQQVWRKGLGEPLKRLGSQPDTEAMTSPETMAEMRVATGRPFVVRSAEHAVRADRPTAAFASWYELFPRSATHDPQVHGTFRSVIERLPAIQAMGFDVLYFPPIHPIGTVNRKGRNNSLRAAPGDVGSPYAIGSAAGGHDAVHPQLGTLDDFRALVVAARGHGLEIALDFAVQCAPDHPWLTEHRDWFRWRPDGSMRYAENPPKKYEDIVNPDFYGKASFPAVWLALRDAIQFWVDEGVRIFRVDNPHTKPLPFWQWMIADIQSRHPDVLFLAEAFTRPKLMYRLAKIGFSQSYTYFTWRNTKQEIIEYLTELAAPPVAGFFRPNFFVNTPDINPVYLQTAGRPGFLIRAALATTLSGLWGMYSGFEICESAPLPGREEYLDSEKYELRPRDYDADGNIIAEITTLNRLRRLYPSLQSHLGVRFYPAANDQVLFYGKGDILVAVSLDPHAVQEAIVELPLWRLGLPDHAILPVADVVRGNHFTWVGKYQRLRFDPGELPFHIWHLPAAIA
ncbi:MAG: DUF3416 domain-containing protein [Proteobacteria bacterium]|nr:DUF3416 domain-containing protein [Pseudomonadota bacterium]